MIKVYSIEQMCKTTADMTRLFLELREKNICSKFVETATEGVHALILSLIEVMQSGSQMDIDFFNRMLSRHAAADPAAVSRGIGTALYATGFGIFIALYAMMFFNYFNNKVEEINNQMKLISLTVLGAR